MLSRVRLFATLCTIAHQAPLSMRILQARESWSGLPFPPGDLPSPGIKPMSSALQGGFSTTARPGSPRPFYSVLLKTHLQGRSPSSLSCLTMPQVCVLFYLRSFLSCGRRTFSACLKRSAGDCFSNPQLYPAGTCPPEFSPQAFPSFWCVCILAAGILETQMF